MMSYRNSLVLFALLPAIAALGACGAPPENTETPEEYAARINGAAAPEAPASPTGTAPPTNPPVPEGAAPGLLAKNTQTDPAASTCGAPEAAEYLGQQDSSEIRQAIIALAPPNAGVRFLRPGEARDADFVQNRLNVMYDASGVIRDFRCG